tara:strand:- start:2281 stop:2919 length:639 start_codon:yes stop_codon:yes gene_type:complete
MFTLPTHETTLPALEKTVHIQPLTVRDEKVIAAAKRAGSKLDSYITFIEILKDKIDIEVNTLSEVDLIHCMLHLRKISIGSVSKVNFVCPYTQERVDATINLNDISLNGSKTKTTLRSNGFIVKLTLPKKIKDVESGIESIQTEEETIIVSELPDQQKKDLLDSLPIKVKNEISENLNDILNYSYDVEYETNQKHSIPLRSAEDFFTLFFVM